MPVSHLGARVIWKKSSIFWSNKKEKRYLVEMQNPHRQRHAKVVGGAAQRFPGIREAAHACHGQSNKANNSTKIIRRSIQAPGILAWSTSAGCDSTTGDIWSTISLASQFGLDGVPWRWRIKTSADGQNTWPPKKAALNIFLAGLLAYGKSSRQNHCSFTSGASLGKE